MLMFHECSLLHLIVLSISHQQWTCVMTYLNNNNSHDNGWLLYSANPPVKKTRCAIKHHSHIYTHRHKHNLTLYSYTPQSTWICENACWKKKVLSWALKSERMGRFRKLAGSEIQTVGAIKLKERSPTDLRLHLGIFKCFLFDDRRVREVWYVQREAER